MSCRQTSTAILAMSRKLFNISKTLALLAVAMLPIAQTLAASCCCRSARLVGEHGRGGSHTSCCLQALASCCSSASASHGSCCDGESNPDSKPCRCPAGLCGIDVPVGLESATDATSADDDLRVNALATVPAIACAVNCQTACESLLVSTPHASISSPERCSLLCRYRL